MLHKTTGDIPESCNWMIWGQNSITWSLDLKEQRKHQTHFNPLGTWKSTLPLPKLFPVCKRSNLGVMKKVIPFWNAIFCMEAGICWMLFRKSDWLQRVQYQAGWRAWFPAPLLCLWYCSRCGKRVMDDSPIRLAGANHAGQWFASFPELWTCLKVWWKHRPSNLRAPLYCDPHMTVITKGFTGLRGGPGFRRPIK